jgi:hypothetical protein
MFPLGAAECGGGGQEEPFCPPLGPVTPVVQIIERLQDVPEEPLFCLTADHRLIVIFAP